MYTRQAPPESPRPPGRIGADDLVAHGWPPDFEPTCYVCGPTPLVEAVAGLLADLHRSHGLTSIIVTHNLSLAKSCDRVLQLEKGVFVPWRADANPSR